MLTTTASKLVAMTDRAAFERLALHVLRYAETDCAAVIRLGTNPAGETIVSPLDGFACVAGATTPLYVAVESTTTDPNQLERKWLYDHRTGNSQKRSAKKKPTEADDGDLLKAARKAAELRLAQPLARFKVYLATNQIVSPDLRAKVDTVARKLNVECEVWEQSRIADFLDIEPTGQYLRSAYLGAPAERLSIDLILSVGRADHKDYAYGGRVASDPSTWTARSLDLEVIAHANALSTRAILLVGESGFGKTVAAHQVMGNWLRRDAPSLWVRAELVESNASLYGAIDAVIRDRVPTMAEYCTRTLSAALQGSRLLVIIDDINRAASPANLLRRVLTWASATPDVVLLCPVWPRFLNSFDLMNRPEIRQVRVGVFSPSESEAALGGIGGHELAAALDHDPFLIGLTRALAQCGLDVQSTPKPRDVLRRFVEHRLQSMQAGDSGFRATCDTSEHYAALARTSRASIEHKNLAPTTALVKQWINDERVWSAMAEVLQDSAIIRTTGGDQIAYRHDRVRDHLLADAMAASAKDDPSCSAMRDPFFAELAAEALVRLSTPEPLVEALADDEPLVLVAALRVVDAGSEAERRIVRTLRKWYANELARSAWVRVRFVYSCTTAKSIHVVGTFNSWAIDDTWKLAPSAKSSEWVLNGWLRPGTYQFKVVLDRQRWIGPKTPTAAPDGYGAFNAVIVVDSERAGAQLALRSARHQLMYRELACIDSVAVLAVTQELPQDDDDVLLARFRNGDVLAAIAFCASHLGDPKITYLPRNDAIASVQRRHIDAFNRDFLAVSRQLTTDRDRLGAICLAGYIRHVEMLREAGRLWREADNRYDLLPQALWAQLTAADGTEDFATIEEIFRLFLEVPDETTESVYSTKRSRVNELLRMSNVAISRALVNWLVAFAGTQPELLWTVWTLLAQVDLAEAVEAMVRLAAADEGSMHAMLIGDWWRQSGRKMGKASSSRLQGIWRDDNESEGVRRKAFRLWTIGADRQADALSMLRAVGETSPLYEAAVATRARLGDRSVETAFATLLSSTQHWARLGSRVWGPSIESVVARQLAEWSDPTADSNEAHYLADLLTLAPRDAARTLLVDHWPRIRTVRQFVQAALAIGGHELDSLVAESIAEWPTDSPPPLEHAVLHMEMGHEDGLVAPVDEGRVERLLHYRTLLGDFDLKRLGVATREHGFPLWGREHVAPHLTNNARAEVFPTASDLMQQLDELSKATQNQWLRSRRWAEIAEERCDGLYDALDILDLWLSNNPTDGPLSLAADLVVALGRRSGISVLARHSNLSDVSQRKRLDDVALLVRRGSLAVERACVVRGSG